MVRARTRQRHGTRQPSPVSPFIHELPGELLREEDVEVPRQEKRPCNCRCFRGTSPRTRLTFRINAVVSVQCNAVCSPSQRWSRWPVPWRAIPLMPIVAASRLGWQREAIERHGARNPHGGEWSGGGKVFEHLLDRHVMQEVSGEHHVTTEAFPCTRAAMFTVRPK